MLDDFDFFCLLLFDSDLSFEDHFFYFSTF